MSKLISTVLNTEMRRPRRIGYTTKIAKVAKELDGYVVCANKDHAKLVEQEFQVKTITPHQITDGMKCILFWDSYAFTEIYNEFDKLQSEVKKFKKLFEEESKANAIISEKIDKLEKSHKQLIESAWNNKDKIEKLEADKKELIDAIDKAIVENGASMIRMERNTFPFVLSKNTQKILTDVLEKVMGEG